MTDGVWVKVNRWNAKKTDLFVGHESSSWGLQVRREGIPRQTEPDLPHPPAEHFNS